MSVDLGLFLVGRVGGSGSLFVYNVMKWKHETNKEQEPDQPLAYPDRWNGGFRVVVLFPFHSVHAFIITEWNGKEQRTQTLHSGVYNLGIGCNEG